MKKILMLILMLLGATTTQGQQFGMSAAQRAYFLYWLSNTNIDGQMIRTNTLPADRLKDHSVTTEQVKEIDVVRILGAMRWTLFTNAPDRNTDPLFYTIGFCTNAYIYVCFTNDWAGLGTNWMRITLSTP